MVLVRGARVNDRVGGWAKDGWTAGQMGRRTGQTNVWTARWTDGRMNTQTGGQMDGQGEEGGVMEDVSHLMPNLVLPICFTFYNIQGYYYAGDLFYPGPTGAR